MLGEVCQQIHFQAFAADQAQRRELVDAIDDAAVGLHDVGALDAV